MRDIKTRTAALSIISNSLLTMLKLLVGIKVGAVSLISEALHSGLDLGAALIAFWAVKTAEKPPDTAHDYGHGKFENLSALVEALLIVGAAVAIVGEAVDKFNDRAPLPGMEYGILVMLMAVVVNTLVYRRLLKVAKLTESQALEADGLHLKADVWTSAGVLLGLTLMAVTDWGWLDAVIAIMVAGMIFKAGGQMAYEAVLELTDASLPEETEKKIGRLIAACPEVKGYHCLRTRRSGSYKLLDVHVQFDGNMHLARVHAVCDELEEEIRAAFGTFDVVIHPEPLKYHPEETKVSFYEHAHRI
ncbi:MAG: cation transporter [Selenomonadaceae bacterium]|nr:cation transporter [Selenomonadaceae bacterium]